MLTPGRPAAMQAMREPDTYCCEQMQDAVEPGAHEPEIRVTVDGALYMRDSDERLRFCPWCGAPTVNQIHPAELGFEHLEFQSTSIMGDLQQATMVFANGYQIRVNADMASAGWEFSILRNGQLCGTLPTLCDKEIYRAIDEQQVTELMRQVAALASP